MFTHLVVQLATASESVLVNKKEQCYLPERSLLFIANNFCLFFCQQLANKSIIKGA